MSEISSKNWAVINLGGKQHLVSTGVRFQVNQVDQKEGESFEVKDVLNGQPVKLTVVTHLLGKKINGLKFKNKVRYIRHYGHRQQLSSIEVVSVGEKAKAAPAVAPEAAIKKAPAKKPASKKAVKNG